MSAHQEGQDTRGGQMIEEEEARLDMKAAKTTKGSLLAVVPKDDGGRMWSQVARKERERSFPLHPPMNSFNKAANQQGSMDEGRKKERLSDDIFMKEVPSFKAASSH